MRRAYRLHLHVCNYLLVILIKRASSAMVSASGPVPTAPDPGDCGSDRNTRAVRAADVDLPVQVSSAGMDSLMLMTANKAIGGVIMLYMNGCPHCEAAYVRGDPSCELAKLAREVHYARAGIVAVANGPRLSGSMPVEIERLVKGWPTFILISTRGEVVAYQGERTAEALSIALTELNEWDEGMESRKISKWGELLEERNDALLDASNDPFGDDYAAHSNVADTPSAQMLDTSAALREAVAGTPETSVMLLLVTKDRATLPTRMATNVRTLAAKSSDQIAVAFVPHEVAKQALAPRVMQSAPPFALIMDNTHTAFMLPGVSRDMVEHPEEAATAAVRAAQMIITRRRDTIRRIDDAEETHEAST